MKETFYFSHDYNARNDEKILKLIQKEKLHGYGIYWILIEKLYEANGFLEEDYECLAFDMRTDSECIKRVINNYKLFTVSNKKISSKSVLARLRVRKGKSEKARQSAIIRWNKQNNNNANAMRTQCDSNAIKESKVKYNKVKYIELKSQIEKFKKEYSISLIEDFMFYWDEKGKSGKRRWEMEKTWDISLRLKKWKKNQDKWDWEKSQRNQLKQVNEYPTQRVNTTNTGCQSLKEIIK